MKTIYVQYQDGIPITVNTYIAEYGFRRKSYDIVHFTKQDVERWKENPEFNKGMRSAIFVGGTQTLLDVIDLMDIKRPPTYNMHEVLPQYCGRVIYNTTLGKARDMNDNGESFFIKPAEDTKIFTGFVSTNEIDFIKLRQLPAGLEVLISEVIDIKSEYRCFVNRGMLVDSKHYNGDFRIPINLDIVDNAIKDFKDQPISYTLDFGITAEGKQVLIEVNDGFSLGYCGIHPYTYCRFLEDRWEELIRQGR